MIGSTKVHANSRCKQPLNLWKSSGGRTFQRHSFMFLAFWRWWWRVLPDTLVQSLSEVVSWINIWQLWGQRNVMPLFFILRPLSDPPPPPHYYYYSICISNYLLSLFLVLWNSHNNDQKTIYFWQHNHKSRPTNLPFWMDFSQLPWWWNCPTKCYCTSICKTSVQTASAHEDLVLQFKALIKCRWLSCLIVLSHYYFRN